MKNLLNTFMLFVLLSSQTLLANDGNSQKDLKKNKMVVHSVSGHLQSTIQFDGEHTVNFGILNQSNIPVTVQLLWDNTSMMRARYSQTGIQGGFDISALPAGNYRLRICSGNEIIEREFNKTTSATPIFE